MLEKDLQCRVIIIPEYPGELSGHADDLIRFINDNNVLISDTRGEPEKKGLQEFLDILKKNNLTTVELPCPMDLKQSTAEGLYINNLQVGNLIVVPQFILKKEDANTLAIIKEVFGSRNSLVSDALRIAEGGGVLNCALEREKEMQIQYKGYEIGTHRADFFVEDEIMDEGYN